ncbi:MAG: segregation/condensation protein A [Candidatus Zixiibacteriota bacterium]
MTAVTCDFPTPQGTDGAQLGPFDPERSLALSVKLDVFEGPLDLLLFLIKRDEIDITDIPIARITSEYLALLKVMEFCDLEIAGEYILMAATLIRIKSAMLLPRDPETEEEEDPREELVLALMEYRKYKEAAARLKDREDREREIYARTDFTEGETPSVRRFVMDRTLFDLLSAMRDVIARVEPETFHRVEVEEFTVEDRIAQVDELLQTTPQLEFASLFLELPSRWLIVLTFLALLEMTRLRRIRLSQERPFAPMYILRADDWAREQEVPHDRTHA